MGIPWDSHLWLYGMGMDCCRLISRSKSLNQWVTHNACVSVLNRPRENELCSANDRLSISQIDRERSTVLISPLTISTSRNILDKRAVYSMACSANKKLSRCWDSETCEPLDASIIAVEVPHWPSSIEIGITWYYPGRLWHAVSLNTDLPWFGMCPFPPTHGNRQYVTLCDCAFASVSAI